MKQGYKIFIVELVISFIVALLGNGFLINYDLFTLCGLINFIASILTLIAGIITAAVRDKEISNALFLSAGLLLLAGVGTCSIFPIRLNAAY